MQFFYFADNPRAKFALVNVGVALCSSADGFQSKCSSRLRSGVVSPSNILRKKRRAERRPTKATNIPNRVSIHQRPPEANGKRFGDWEMDLIVDSRQRALLTLTEMSTNLILIEKLKCGKNAMNVAKTVCRLLLPFRDYVLSITADNGSEFAAHQYITQILKAQVYFTDTYSSWQKGRIENGNKLIRFYLPKDTDLKDVNDKLIKKIQKELNARPRKKTQFQHASARVL